MPEKQETVHQFPVRLRAMQRRSIAELAPEFSDRLKLNEQNQRVIAFSLPELKRLYRKIRSAIPPDAWDMKRRALRDAMVLIDIIIEEGDGIGRIPRAQRIYQFKITLHDTRPPIWRRIQVKDCTLDKLHERIQTAMGWTNSHLNHFRINDAALRRSDAAGRELRRNEVPGFDDHENPRDPPSKWGSIRVRVRVRLRGLLVAQSPLRRVPESRARLPLSPLPRRRAGLSPRRRGRNLGIRGIPRSPGRSRSRRARELSPLGRPEVRSGIIRSRKGHQTDEARAAELEEHALNEIDQSSGCHRGRSRLGTDARKSANSVDNRRADVVSYS